MPSGGARGLRRVCGGVQAMSKDLLYGTLDGTTLEWTDGVFTATLRQVPATHIAVFLTLVRLS